MADGPNLQHLEVANADDYSDASSIGGESTGSSLSSLRSSIREHRRENGRRYHALSEGSYVLPNDEKEQDRLDLQHHLWQLTWDGKLCMCPKNERAKRVLDVGTGTGIWVMDFADEHPEAMVIGVDLSPIQPDFVPSNCSFEIDDADKEWTWSVPFDLIFVRHMNACFASWEKMIAQAYKNLEPGGYLELQDNSLPIDCTDGTLAEDCPLYKWSALIVEGTGKIGRPATVPKIFKRMLEDAGFEDVVEEKRIWPMNDWPKDKKLQELGLWCQASSVEAIEAAALALFTRVLGWTREETLTLCAGVRQDFVNRNIHGFYNVYCVYGRKPMEEPTSRVQ